MPLPVRDVAKLLGLLDEDLIPYGEYKAKIRLSALERLASRSGSRLILVTAITPTPAGEGKTVTTIGLETLCAVSEKTPRCASVSLRYVPCLGKRGWRRRRTSAGVSSRRH